MTATTLAMSMLLKCGKVAKADAGVGVGGKIEEGVSKFKFWKWDLDETFDYLEDLLESAKDYFESFRKKHR